MKVSFCVYYTKAQYKGKFGKVIFLKAGYQKFIIYPLPF